MKCRRCGKDLENSSRCKFCGFDNVGEGNVREMTRAEKNFYNGVTIDAGGTEENYSRSRGRNFSGGQTFVNVGGSGFFSRLFEKFLRGLMNDSLLAKIIAGLIFLALAAIFFVMALPILFFMIALGVALFLYARFKV